VLNADLPGKICVQSFQDLNETEKLKALDVSTHGHFSQLTHGILTLKEKMLVSDMSSVFFQYLLYDKNWSVKS
jgi:hypothetical protein